MNDIDDANEEIRRECFEPKQLFYETPPKLGVQSPARSDPTGHRRRSKKENRTLVKTAQGKSVLSSDIRLHLEKVKAQTQQAQEEEQRDLIETDGELARLDKERRVLQAKVRQRKEIQRLQLELEHASEGRVSTEYQTEERESSWRQSGDSTYSGQEESTASFSSKHRRKRRPADDDSEEEGPQRSSKLRPPDLSKLQDDVALCKNFIRTHSTGLEVSHESPLSEDIESSKIDRRLKVPPIEQFDGSSDPADFINLFDGRMSFYGHSDVARCRFFYTCLKGTALKWFNNLPPRSIDSWVALKTKFRTRFSSNRKGGKITASLMTVHQKEAESLRDFLARFRAEVAEIPNLIDDLAINYLAAGVDKKRHGLLLEEFFDKNPRTLQAALQIFEHRLTLQEAVGSIQSSPPKPKWDRSSSQMSRWEPKRNEVKSEIVGPHAGRRRGHSPVAQPNAPANNGLRSPEKKETSPS